MIAENTMEASPLHTELLRKGSRRVILSSDEEERPSEVPDIPLECSTPKCCTGGSYQQLSNSPDDVGTIIEFTYGDASGWDTELDTSTPDFKRGKHGEEDKLSPEAEPLNPLTALALAELQQHGWPCRVPSWIRRRTWTRHSVLILADSQLNHWPTVDRICQVILKDWPVKRWAQAIKAGEVRVKALTVVLYLEGTRNWADVPPVKNALQALCKTIRNYNTSGEPRIFIANHLPRFSGSPVSATVPTTNFILQQATRSICRSISRVFEASIYEHFTSKKGKLITPVLKHFLNDHMLTRFGCLIFRECLLREVGVKPYWFADSVKRRLRQEKR